jgi:hypothetical protein
MEWAKFWNFCLQLVVLCIMHVAVCTSNIWCLGLKH